VKNPTLSAKLNFARIYSGVALSEYASLLSDLRGELLLSIEYLEYSYNKVQKNSLALDAKDPETLETLEALVSRFARVADIFVAKYLRTYALSGDPGYQGTLVDTIYFAEKKGLIESAKNWIAIRELRNKIALEYASRNLSNIFRQVIDQTPIVLKIKKQLG